MYKLVLGFVLLLTVAFSAKAQTDVTGGNTRRNTPVLTPQDNSRIAETNAVAQLAAEELNNAQLGATSNRRRTAPVIIASHTTRDGVQIFKAGDDETKVVYDLDHNAFVPVRTRQQATRVATRAFEPVDDAAGKKLKKRKANKKGKKAELILDVKEDRKKNKTKEAEEEALED